MKRFDREISRRIKKNKMRRAYALYGKYTRQEDLEKCQCKRHKK